MILPFRMHIELHLTGMRTVVFSALVHPVGDSHPESEGGIRRHAVAFPLLVMSRACE